MKKLFVLSTICILSFIFTGCLSGKRNVEGTYHYSPIFEIGYELLIDSNNTFVFSWLAGLNTGKTTGTWRKKGSNFILNGGTKPPKRKIIVEESLQGNIDSVYLDVRNFDMEPVEGGVVVINNERISLSNLHGSAVVRRKESVRKINVYIPFLDVSQYKVKKPLSNHFKIWVYTIRDNEIYFENAKVKIRHDKLIIPIKPFSKRKIILKKVKL